jgi:acetate kinase
MSFYFTLQKAQDLSVSLTFLRSFITGAEMIEDLAVKPCLLTINGGSSSIKFAIFESTEPLAQVFKGSMDRIGCENPTLQGKGLHLKDGFSQTISVSNHAEAVDFLIDWIDQQKICQGLVAIGHRVVHGGSKYNTPQKITENVIDDLRSFIPFAPDHLPLEILLIEAFYRRFSNLLQVVCFDTAFHHDLPRVARLLPIPRHYESLGVRRYGFHGLSYAFLMQELERLEGSQVAQGKIILAHLGSGVSLAAVFRGKPVDTSMGFTPTAGVPMSTRSGDLDPALLEYLSLKERMGITEWSDMVNCKSGLLGMSETSADIRELLQFEEKDLRASEAVSLFCYQIKKWIGAFSAALGGLDTLIFTGGIGENLPVVRARICENLEFLGIEMDEKKNTANEPVVSSARSRGTVRVIRADEERMIVQAVYLMLDRETKGVKR